MVEIPGQLELKRLLNGTIILTPEAIKIIHNIIIQDRKLLGKNDPNTIRDEGLIRHIYDSLLDRPHKFKKDATIENAFYVATETFYFIACEHPFTEGNKSTAYICSLLVLKINFGLTQEYLIDNTPKEVEEIVKLAEGGKDSIEIKKLIKEFLQKEIREKHGKEIK